MKGKISTMAVEGWSESITAYENSKNIDSAFKQTFLNKKNTTEYRYEELFKYFAYGHIKYQSPKGAYVNYPGEISGRGRKINGLEGFARFFPLAASWLSSNRSENVILNDTSYNLVNILKKGLLNGTDPICLEYWGDVSDYDQRIVEAADIALSLWISKDQIWVNLTSDERYRIVRWLELSINKKVGDNNWKLFPVTIIKVLESLGASNKKDLKYANELFETYKNKHYLGEGWYDDPPKGIDYYNAWSIHYALFWLDQIDPNFDHDFIKSTHSEFVKFYKFFFGKNGFPMMGRSVCYRLAAPSPIISATILSPNEISLGFAMRTLDLTWIHFIENNALQDGIMTQGYYDDDLRILDNYSGTGSCLWSLRSLIVAFYVDRSRPLFKADEQLLPVEVSNFEITNKTVGWTIIGDKSNHKISLRLNKNDSLKSYELLEYSFKNKFKELITKRPWRPDNTKALYENNIYSTDAELFIIK
ncbi:DUF2264 domain-containing protein [Gelidibacter mesophilus]|uniref:DUF2264 domain-containing protein n=1 Tax=Gelidibacter mesophilus TaxID=169050 RepID=UPI001B7F9EB5|nr:DUF2264 domain-containing protein [Gelidibacter mesophilus]